MIIDFTVKNYLSIKDEVVLSFLSESKDNENMNTYSVDNGKYLVYPFGAIYGANASGKSNLIKALKDFSQFVTNSHRLDVDNPIPYYKPFRLDTSNTNAPISFSIEFIVSNIRYAYSIEFEKYNVLKEKLVYYPEGRKSVYFSRDKNEIKYGTRFIGERKSIENFLLPNRLFLSVLSNSTNDILKSVYLFFRETISIHNKMDSSNNLLYNSTVKLRDESNDFKIFLLKMLKASDINVEEIKLIEDQNINEKLNGLPDKLKQRLAEDLKDQPYIGHPVFNHRTKTDVIEYFSLNEEESSGTIKMYELSASIIHALKNGNILFIDEFNSGLHPLLSKLIVELFLDPEINKNKAQLFVATHDVCVLDAKILNREQIWFSEKDKYGSTQLYSLDEFDKNYVRNKSKYGDKYLDGRFKALPNVSLNELKEFFDAKEKS